MFFCRYSYFKVISVIYTLQQTPISMSRNYLCFHVSGCVSIHTESSHIEQTGSITVHCATWRGFWISTLWSRNPVNISDRIKLMWKLSKHAVKNGQWTVYCYSCIVTTRVILGCIVHCFTILLIDDNKQTRTLKSSCKTCNSCKIWSNCKTWKTYKMYKICRFCNIWNTCTICTIYMFCNICKTCKTFMTCKSCKSCKLCKTCKSCKILMNCKTCKTCKTCKI